MRLSLQLCTLAILPQVIDKQGFELIRKVQEVTTNNERPIPEVMISETEVVFEAPKS